MPQVVDLAGRQGPVVEANLGDSAVEQAGRGRYDQATYVCPVHRAGRSVVAVAPRASAVDVHRAAGGRREDPGVLLPFGGLVRDAR